MQTAWSPRAGGQPFPSPRELLGSAEQEGMAVMAAPWGQRTRGRGRCQVSGEESLYPCELFFHFAKFF